MDAGVGALRETHHTMQHTSKNHYSATEREYLNWYKARGGEPFDPTPLVRAASEQWGHRPELIAALASCTRQWRESELYTHFVDTTKAKAPGDRWRFAFTLELKCAVHGELNVDVKQHAEDKSRFAIHGIEFMDKVMGNSTERAPKQAQMKVVHSKYKQ